MATSFELRTQCDGALPSSFQPGSEHGLSPYALRRITEMCEQTASMQHSAFNMDTQQISSGLAN